MQLIDKVSHSLLTMKWEWPIVQTHWIRSSITIIRGRNSSVISHRIWEICNCGFINEIEDWTLNILTYIGRLRKVMMFECKNLHSILLLSSTRNSWLFAISYCWLQNLKIHCQNPTKSWKFATWFQYRSLSSFFWENLPQGNLFQSNCETNKFIFDCEVDRLHWIENPPAHFMNQLKISQPLENW
jgi:hypothetical protein